MVTAARSGDPASVSSLLEAAWPSAYRVARALLDDTAAAEDAAQDACVRALGALSSLREPDRFAPWFYRIVVNEAKQRRRVRSREIALEGDVLRAHLAWTDRHESVDDRLDVRRAIDALEPKLRAAIVLRYYCGLTSSDIGKIVRTSPITVRWRIMQAHRVLRTSLAPGRAASLSAILAIVLVAAMMAGVVAGVQRIVQVFSVAAGRTIAIPVRTVDLNQARRDMPFIVIAPPVLERTERTTIAEVGDRNDLHARGVIFTTQIEHSHREITIVETAARRARSPGYLALRESGGSSPSTEPLPRAPGRPRGLVLRGSLEGRAFAPTTWTVGNTRIVLLSPPGALSAAQIHRIAVAMSR